MNTENWFQEVGRRGKHAKYALGILAAGRRNRRLVHHRRLRVRHGGGECWTVDQWLTSLTRWRRPGTRLRKQQPAGGDSCSREPEEKIVNEGEMNLQLLAESGHTGKSQHIRCTVEAAKVTRPLSSVGKNLRQRHRCTLQEGLCCDHGCQDREGAHETPTRKRHVQVQGEAASAQAG